LEVPTVWRSGQSTVMNAGKRTITSLFLSKVKGHWSKRSAIGGQKRYRVEVRIGGGAGVRREEIGIGIGIEIAGEVGAGVRGEIGVEIGEIVGILGIEVEDEFERS